MSPLQQSPFPKYIAYTIFLLISFFSFVYPIQAEVYVITANDGQVYLSSEKKHNIKKGMLLQVYRQKGNTKINIAKIKVTQVSSSTSEASVASVVSQESDMEIEPGDRIEIIPKDEGKDEKQLKKSGNKSRNIKAHWSFLETGITVLGGAVYFHQLAEKAYSRYKKANSLDEAVSYREETELNDRRTKIALGVSLTLIGISTYLWKEDTLKSPNPSVSFLSSHLKTYVSFDKIIWAVEFHRVP